MNFRKEIKTLLLLVFFFAAANGFAQIDEPDGNQDNGNAPLDPAPIGDYIVPMLLLGVATGFVLLKRRSAVKPL